MDLYYNFVMIFCSPDTASYADSRNKTSLPTFTSSLACVKAYLVYVLPITSFLLND